MRRLGLQPLLDEVKRLVESTKILVLEMKREGSTSFNGAAAIRILLDATFEKSESWLPKKSGDVDWSKCKVVNGTRVCVGVEIQISARSELLYKDILHLKKRIEIGDIDVGIIVVPSDRLQSYLPDRTPSASYARKVLHEQDADRLPIVLIEMEHDGPGPPLGKKVTNLSRRGNRRG
ncbi:MAG TPA: BglII/BstYI family type II restriction endonuclease [Bryobacteraceae bacterium]|nr:BglII/BstYI family type II restriction endonuclease [Bryobacteraceae bacterium]